jgi:hypothetical protein
VINKVVVIITKNKAAQLLCFYIKQILCLLSAGGEVHYRAQDEYIVTKHHCAYSVLMLEENLSGILYNYIEETHYRILSTCTVAMSISVTLLRLYFVSRPLPPPEASSTLPLPKPMKHPTASPSQVLQAMDNHECQSPHPPTYLAAHHMTLVIIPVHRLDF